MSITSKILYALIALAFVLYPHVIEHDVGGIPEPYVESLVALMLVGGVYLLYSLHQRDLRRKEAERRVLEKELDISSSKLNEAFRYIGLVNRRLPLLKNVTSDLLGKMEAADTKQGKKGIFYDLLMSAAMSIARTNWAMFRFIETDNKRTVREFVYTASSFVLLKHEIGNQDLVIGRVNGDHWRILDDINVFATSDHRAPVQCFLILPTSANDIPDEQLLLQSIVDQAQLFHKYLYEK